MEKNEAAHKVCDIPITTGKPGTEGYAEGSFKLDLPTLTEAGFEWACKEFGKDEILEGFIKSYVIAKQAPERKALTGTNGKAARKARGVLAKLAE